MASHRSRVRLDLPDVSLELVTDRGVFAADAVDAGTKLLLLESAAVRAGGGDTAGDNAGDGAGDLLDLGCGYGPIAVTLAVRSPGATVWAVDVNARALELVAENAHAAGVGDRVRVCAPEEVPDGVRFAGIWSNPPIRIGKAALHALLLQWLPRLGDGAAAWMVVHKHLGSDSLARWLADQGYGVTRVASRGGYRVLSATAGR